MGFRVNLFEKEPDRDMICSICMGVYENPVVDVCGHFFCSDCLSPWFRKTGRCPISNESIQAPLPSENLANRIYHLRIKCVECNRNYVSLDKRVSGCTECSIRRATNRTDAEDSYARRYNSRSIPPQQTQKQQSKSSWKSDVLKWGAIAGAVGTVLVVASSASKSNAQNRN